MIQVWRHLRKEMAPGGRRKWARKDVLPKCMQEVQKEDPRFWASWMVIPLTHIEQKEKTRGMKEAEIFWTRDLVFAYISLEEKICMLEMQESWLGSRYEFGSHQLKDGNGVRSWINPRCDPRRELRTDSWGCPHWRGGQRKRCWERSLRMACLVEDERKKT